MSKHLTGIDGELYCDDARIAKVRGWSITGSVDALETTTMADAAKTYASGMQSYSGRCSAFCYEDNVGRLESAALASSVYRTDGTPYNAKHRLKLMVNGQTKARALECDVVITSVATDVAAGDAVALDISFVVTGHLIQAGLGVF